MASRSYYNPRRAGPRRAVQNNNGSGSGSDTGGPREPPSISLEEAIARRGSGSNGSRASFRSDETTVVRSGHGGYRSDDAIAAGRRAVQENASWLFGGASRSPPAGNGAAAGGGHPQQYQTRNNGNFAMGHAAHLSPQRSNNMGNNNYHQHNVGNDSNGGFNGSRKKNVIGIFAVSIMVMVILHIGDFGSSSIASTKSYSYVANSKAPTGVGRTTMHQTEEFPPNTNYVVNNEAMGAGGATSQFIGNGWSASPDNNNNNDELGERPVVLGGVGEKSSAAGGASAQFGSYAHTPASDNTNNINELPATMGGGLDNNHQQAVLGAEVRSSHQLGGFAPAPDNTDNEQATTMVAPAAPAEENNGAASAPQMRQEREVQVEQRAMPVPQMRQEVPVEQRAMPMLGDGDVEESTSAAIPSSPEMRQDARATRRKKLRQSGFRKPWATKAKETMESQEVDASSRPSVREPDVDNGIELERDIVDVENLLANLMDKEGDNNNSRQDSSTIALLGDHIKEEEQKQQRIQERTQLRMQERLGMQERQQEPQLASTWSELFAEVIGVQNSLAIAASVPKPPTNIAGSPAFCIHPREGDASEAFQPSEILIEVLNPKPDCRYSVTIVSKGRYTGTAMLMSELPAGLEGTVIMQEPGSLLHSWSPIFAGHYEVLVHEIDQVFAHETPLIQPPFPILISEGKPGLGMSLLEERIRSMRPCQTKDNLNIYSQWDGDWLGPDFDLHEQVRSGWSFLPSPRMNCKLETFTKEMLQAIPEKKSIYILGRSVERGVFLSLVDMLLDFKEAEKLKDSVINKCWGRASVSKGNLEMMYQEFRVDAFEDPMEPRYIECHNENLVKQPGSSFIENATAVWEEVFNKDKSTWPSVVFLTTGLGSPQFLFEHHVVSFVHNLPPTWRGTLFLGDFQFSARAAGLVTTHEYLEYLQEIRSLTRQLSDPRIRWIDGIGISKEMRMYGHNGQNHVARSQHFHHPCAGKDMAMCSNTTELVGQLLLSHALGPKEELMKQVKANKPMFKSSTPPATWCHACPKCMLPFHITPYPEMTCVTGAIEANTSNDADCARPGEDVRGGPSAAGLMCPKDCLLSSVTSSFGTELDTVYVRQCPIDGINTM